MVDLAMMGCEPCSSESYDDSGSMWFMMIDYGSRNDEWSPFKHHMMITILTSKEVITSWCLNGELCDLSNAKTWNS